MEKIQIRGGYYTINEYGRFHSYNDEPAISIETFTSIDPDGQEYVFEGYKSWLSDGKLHRENGPAVIRDDGKEYYYIYDNLVQ
jgi:hypothetical protein